MKGALYGPLSFMSNQYLHSGENMSKTEEYRIHSVLNDNRKVKTPIDRPIECPPEYSTWYSQTLQRKLKNAEWQRDFLFERYSGLVLTENMRKINASATFSNFDIPKSLRDALNVYGTAYKEKINEIFALKEMIYLERDKEVMANAGSADA